jgi:hypothetical protein
MADFSTTTPVPGITTAYTSVLSIINDKFTDLVKGLDTTPTNLPTNAIAWSSVANKWRKWDGAAWQNLSDLYAINISGNAATATSSTSATNIAITNDVTSNITAYPTWVTGTSSGTGVKISSTKISLNPSTGDLTVAGGVTIAGAANSPSHVVTGASGGAAGIYVGTGDGSSSTVANVQMKSWYGIGFAPSITGQTVPQNENAVWIDVRTGAITARGNVTAYSSDERLKTNFKVIDNALSKVQSISGYFFDWDLDLCKQLGFSPSNSSEHGLKAQEIQKIMPDIVKRAPFDEDGNGVSKSGKDYLTVDYEKIVPLLVQAIKELKAELDALKIKTS